MWTELREPSRTEQTHSRARFLLYQVNRKNEIKIKREQV